MRAQAAERHQSKARRLDPELPTRAAPEDVKGASATRPAQVPSPVSRAFRRLNASAVLVPLALFAAVAWWSWRNTERNAAARVERMTLAVEQQARRVFEVQEAVLEAVLARVRGVNPDDLATSRAVHEFLTDLGRRTPSSDLIAIARLDTARLVASSRDFPPADTDLSQADYIRAQRSGNGVTYIGEVLRTPSGTFGFTVSRRVPESNLLALALVHLDDLHAMHSSLAESRADAVGLVRADGVVLARYQMKDAFAGFRLPADAVPLRYIRGEIGPLVRERTVIDGRERLFHFRQVGGYPVYALYGLDTTVIRAAWLRSLVPFALLALLAGTLLAVLARRVERAATVERRAEIEIALARDRVAQADALAASEDRFRQATDATGALVYDVDVRAGDAARTYGAERLVGEGGHETRLSSAWWHARIHPDDLPAHLEHFEHCITDPACMRYQASYRVRHADGSWRHVEDVGHIARGAAGEAVRLIGTIVDVTVRKHAEEALRSSEERFRTLAAGAPVSMFRADAAGGCLYVNEWWQRIAGMSAEQASGNGWTERLHPDDRERIFHAWRDAVERQRPFIAEYRFVSPDGTVTWVLGHALPEAGGGYIGVAVDITARKLAEAQSARDLAAMTELQKLASLSAQDGRLIPVLPAIVDAAIAIGAADCANIQLLDPATGELRIAAARGFPSWWIEFWDSAAKGVGTCSSALERGERVVVEDVERSPVFAGSPALDVQRRAGVRAVQSTPLVGRSGRLLGVFSTHYRTPHRPDDHVLGLLDLLGRQVADIIEQAEAAHALSDSEARLRRIFEQSPAGIVQTDAQGRMVAVNGRWGEMLGYSEAELLSMSVTEITHPDSLAATRDAIGRLAAGGPDLKIEKNYRRKNGTTLRAQSNVAALRDDEGRYLGALVVVIDLTDRLAAEARLRASEERMQQALSASHSFTFEWDATTDQVLRSGSCAPILKLAGEEAVKDTGQRFFRRLHPDDRERLVRILHALTPARPGYTTQYRVVRGEGDTTDLEEVGQGTFDAAGRLMSVVGVTTDITERKQAEATLARTTEVLETLLETAPLGFCHLDRELRFVRINDRLARINGIPTADHLGKTVAEIVPALLPTAMEITQRILATGAAVVGHEFSGYTPADPGVLRHWSETWYPVPDASGAIGGFGVIVEEITARKHAEDALKEADRRKDEFLAMLAHELRNPLAPIRNSLHALGRSVERTATVDRLLAMMERQTTHLVRLVDDLLDVSRIVRGKITLRQERVDLARLAGYAVDAARPRIDAGRHRLEVSLPDEPLWIEADPVRITQVLVNLLDNAAKYMDSGGLIHLKIGREADRALARVTDRGVGIAADMLPRVFGLFTQGDSALERAHGGLGIGLALAKSLVEMHGGTVEAHSEGPGRGSEFVIRLPLADAAGRPAPSPAAATTPATPLRVLVVDDNRDAADSLALLLDVAGMQVEAVYDGAAALESVAVRRPDVVLLDLGMPGMNGFETARRLRETAPGRDLTLIALTGWGQEEDRHKSREAGFDHHLVKPVDPVELQALLDATTPCATPRSELVR